MAGQGQAFCRPKEQNTELSYLLVGGAWSTRLIFEKQAHELPTKLMTHDFLFPPESPTGTPLWALNAAMEGKATHLIAYI